jgi:hypothetical protein
LNPKAWVDPAEGQFGYSAAYYDDYRNKRRPAENMSLERTFRMNENVRLSFRVDFSNVFNRNLYNIGSTTNAKAVTRKDPNTGETLAGFGDIDTKGGSPRMGVIVGRLSF